MTEGGAQQSNPYSTGGGGTNFETRVQAAFALMLLTGRMVPALPPYPLVRLKLQGRYAGFHVDDFIAYVRDPVSGHEAKLLAQIKHAAAITPSDAVFSEVMDAAWRDFNDELFDQDHDALALITGPLATPDVQQVRPLLEWARHSADEHEFLAKVAMHRFSSDGKRGKLAVFRTHLDRANGTAVTDRQLWSFLRRFHLIGYDLDTESGSTHALLLSLIGQTTNDAPAQLWGRIVDAVQTANQNAGTVTLDTLPADLRATFAGSTVTWSRDLERLRSHGRLILDGVRTDVGGVHVDRREVLADLRSLAESERFVWVTGPRGTGKSGVVREFADREQGHVFVLRAEDLDQPSLAQVFSGLGLAGSLADLDAAFALLPRKYLIIEALEKVLELKHQGAFRDLLQFLNRGAGWTILASGRDYAYQPVAFDFLEAATLVPAILPITGFNDAQVQQLCQGLEPLRALAASPELKSLLMVPFLADLAHRVIRAGKVFSSQDGEQEFRDAVWRLVIANEGERTNGLPGRRRDTFIAIALRRAKEMVYGVPADGFDAEAVDRLEEDHLILRDDRTRRLSPAHDVLEDWALDAFIDAAQDQHSRDVRAFLEDVGREPAMNRAFRLWLQRKLRDPDGASEVALAVLRDPGVERSWQDETITAILLSDVAPDFLRQLKSHLLAEDGELLARFCFVLRVSCQTPDFHAAAPDDATPRRTAPLRLRPFGPGWAALVTFALDHAAALPQAAWPHLADVLTQWTAGLNVYIPAPPPAREVGLLALHLLAPLKNQYGRNPIRAALLDVVLSVASAIKEELADLLEHDVFEPQGRRSRPAYARDLRNKMLTLPGAAFVSASHPEALIRLAWLEWVGILAGDDEWERSTMDLDGQFGLLGDRFLFFPASGAKGPFRFLLDFHGLQGVNFVLQLCNHAAEQYARPSRTTSRPPAVEHVELRMTDGSVVTQYFSGQLWSGYRGRSNVPYLLQSALMALENWLITLAELAEYAQASDGVNVLQDVLENVFIHILRGGNSVLTTAVLASVATGFPDILGRVALPLLRHPELYLADIGRRTLEQGGLVINEFAGNHDPFRDVYAQERRTAAERPWRARSLQDLAVQLQFSEMRDPVFAAIDEMRARGSGDERERLLFHRIDTRGWVQEIDERQNLVTFRAGNVEPDLVEWQRQQQTELREVTRFSTMSVWAGRVFDGQPLETAHYPSWRDALIEARALAERLPRTENARRMHEGDLFTAAAVFLRDHLHELTPDEAAWCADVTLDAALRGADEEDPHRGTRGARFNGTGAAASVLPVLLDLAQNEEERQRVREALVVVLTHADEGVQFAAAEGVRLHLWSRDPAFAQHCMAGALEFARFEWERQSRERVSYTATEQIRREAAEEARRSRQAFRDTFLRGELAVEPDAFTSETHHAYRIIAPALIIPDGSVEVWHTRLLSRLLRVFFDAERQSEGGHRETPSTIPLEHAQLFRARFSAYLLGLPHGEFQPFTELLREGCARAPEFMEALQLRLAVTTERLTTKDRYWQFWNVLSPAAQDLAIQTSSDPGDRASDGTRSLIRGLLFADVPWQPVDYDNQHVGLGRSSLLAFARRAGRHPDVFEGLAALMYHFPTLFFDDGVLVLAQWQTVPEAPPVAGNSAYYLEVSIQRYLQVDRPTRLPRRVHEACLVLLTRVVETGSARSYHLRERLVRSGHAV